MEGKPCEVEKERGYMDSEIVKILEDDLKIKVWQINAVIKLLSEGNTIPFIARYRKEVTGALDEEAIRSIETMYKYQENLYNRKLDVIRLIDEKGMMTPELEKEIMGCTKLVDVEDLYLPYKEKKKTKASEAIKNGLEPLANLIMKFDNSDIEKEASKYLNENVKSVQDAITGASYIIAENISDDAKIRKYIRTFLEKEAILKTKVKKNNPDESHVYEMYYDYNERIKGIKPHRVLAINRAEKEKVITVTFDFNKDYLIREKNY